MNGDPRYTPVASRLPWPLPPITRAEAVRAYKRLVNHFGATDLMPVGVKQMRLNMPIRTARTDARRCWISSKPTYGNDKGWARLIHDASHYVFKRRHPTARPHDGGHATLEVEMAGYVVDRDWLAGTLKPPAPVKATAADKLAAVSARLARWEAKAKRAQTAIRKLKAKQKAMIRRQGMS